MWERVLAGLLIAAATAGVGCTSPTPTGPEAAASAMLNGTWTGEVNESYGGRGRLRLTIEQVQFALSGTFRLEFDNPARNRTGTVSGHVDMPQLPQRMQLASSSGFECAAGQPAQSFVQLTWTRNGDTLKGSYSGFGCVGALAATFEVERERR
jgi:hypothetical protein